MQWGCLKLDQELIDVISSDRLEGYSVNGGPNDEYVLLGRYLYNLAISQAMYPFLHTLEIVLRNRIFAALDRAYPSDIDRPDLYDRFPCWLDATPSILLPDHKRLVTEAKSSVANDLRRRYGGTAAAAKRFRTPGRLVAKLSLGFWVYLFDEHYVATGRGEQGLLWPRCFEEVFPHRRGQGSVHAVRKMLRRLLVVRNRTMHYERIIPWADGGGTLNPMHVRRDILTLVGWMSPRAETAIREHGEWSDVFSDTYARHLKWVAYRL